METLSPPKKDHERLLSLNALLQANCLEEAEQQCRDWYTATDAPPHAWLLGGVVARRRGLPLEAEARYTRALELDPHLADAWNNLGNLLLERNDLDAAINAYNRAIQLRAGFGDAWLSLAAAQLRSNNLAAAITAYQRVAELHVQDMRPHLQLFDIYRRLGQGAAAQQAAAETIRRAPKDADAQLTQCYLDKDAGSVQAALAGARTIAAQHPQHVSSRLLAVECAEALNESQLAQQLYGELLQLLPNNAELHCNLGSQLLRNGQPTTALPHFVDADRLGLRAPLLFEQWGHALAQLGRLEEALAVYARLPADYTPHPALATHITLVEQKICLWEHISRYRDTVLQPALQWDGQSLPPLPFPMVVMPIAISEAELRILGQHFATYVAANVIPFTDYPRPLAHAKLRIGYVSADFHNHATSHLMLGLFKCHERSRFDIYAYSLGPDDSSHYRKRIREEVDHFTDIAKLSARQTAQIIHDDEIDVLIDLKGYTKDARAEIFAWRPAPVQIAWLGYPGSMGAPFIDYIITDHIVTPPAAQPDYSERFLFMPHCYQVNDNEQPIADWQPSRTELGLPEQGFVYCCFCALYKIEPVIFAVWMRLLQQTPGAVLWLIDGHEGAKRRLRAAALQARITPERLIFAPNLAKDRHLARHIHADIFLDTYFCNAHTTASDALWAGLPVITAPRNTFASRVCASLLHAVGLPELVVADLEAYEAKARYYAEHPHALRLLKTRLADLRHNCPLFDTQGFVRDLEQQYLLAWNERKPAPSANPVAAGSELEQAIVAYQKGDVAAAERLCRHCLSLDSQRADGWNLLGVLLRNSNRLEEAITAYQRGLSIMPNFADLHNNLANVYKEQSELEKAIAEYRQALALRPDYAEAHSNSGGVLQALGEIPSALKAFQEALRLRPGNPDTRWDYSLCCLLAGDYQTGFSEYEVRWQRGIPAPRNLPGPQWDGSTSPDATLFLYSEQGLGDTLQFLRFLPLAQQRVGRVVLEVQGALQDLVQCIPNITVIAQGSAIPAYSHHYPLISLPYLFGTRRDTLPAEAPYLSAPVAQDRRWRPRVEALPGLKVGLIWAGNPNVKNDRERSPRLQPLLPLFQLSKISFVILQQGDGRRDLDLVPKAAHIHDFAAEISDFSETAAVMRALDLVISSDTSTAHLAGALGVPVWVLTPHIADWRWALSGPSTPWYPTARVFRQPRRGDWAGVVDQVRTALNQRMQRQPLAELQQTLTLWAKRDVPATLAQWEKVRIDWPHHAPTWVVAGVIARARGAANEAVGNYRRALLLDEDNLDAWNNLGNALRDIGDFAGARDAYRQRVARQADNADSWVNLAECERRLGDFDPAHEHIQRALSLKADHVEALVTWGNLAHDQEQTELAESLFRRALALAPNHNDARYNLGVALQLQDKHAEAIPEYNRVLQQGPQQARSLYNRGIAYFHLKRLDEAETDYRAALALEPEHHGACSNLAAVLNYRSRWTEAISWYQRGLELDPDDLNARSEVAHLRQKLCDWSDIPNLRHSILEPALARIDRKRAPPSPFAMLLQPINSSAAEQMQVASHFAAWSERGVKQLLPTPSTRRPGKIRIGYVSADFHNHATSHLMLGLFKRHDRSQFEIHAYSLGPDDGSSYRQRIRNEVDRFVDIAAINGRAAAELIHAQELDILVDLKGYTRDSRPEIFAWRPAPVQIAWLGYPGSMGASFIDYIITDRVVTPPEQQPDYSERFLFMPHCYQVNDNEQVIADWQPTRTELGLPEQGFVYCCFCALYKIEPVIFALWMRLLQQTPGAVLWLIDGQAPAKHNLRMAAQQAGVDPERLIFAPTAPKDRHLARHIHADIFLDTYFCNAHTTASDALWGGVPVITTPRDTFASRVCASLLHAVGLPELVAADLNAYEALALHYARQPEQLRQLKAKLADQLHSCPLFDTDQFTRDLETAYISVLEATGHVD